LITFDDVSKVFAGGATAVDRLSLQVPDGKLTVFVGSSGCGKTTALRMINRMIDPTSGSITVDGKLVCDAVVMCQVVPRVAKKIEARPEAPPE